MMSPEEFKSALPIQLKNSVTDEVMNSINAVLSGPEATAVFKENLLSYTSVLMEGRFKMTSYISAVRYVSFKLLGGTNKAAFTATFPDKMAKWKAAGVSEKDIASYTSAYHKSKLVNLIMEQTLIPTHVLNAPLFQQAINVQADLMLNAHSEKVRSDAAACLIKELKPPEATKIELDLGVKADKTLDTLRETTRALVEQQKRMLAQGTSIRTIAEGVLVVKE
jgi:hypothetical protein